MSSSERKSFEIYSLRSGLENGGPIVEEAVTFCQALEYKWGELGCAGSRTQSGSLTIDRR